MPVRQSCRWLTLYYSMLARRSPDLLWLSALSYFILTSRWCACTYMEIICCSTFPNLTFKKDVAQTRAWRIHWHIWKYVFECSVWFHVSALLNQAYKFQYSFCLNNTIQDDGQERRELAIQISRASCVFLKREQTISAYLFLLFYLYHQEWIERLVIFLHARITLMLWVLGTLRRHRNGVPHVVLPALNSYWRWKYPPFQTLCVRNRL